jgi:hypothetical protein
VVQKVIVELVEVDWAGRMCRTLSRQREKRVFPICGEKHTDHSMVEHDVFCG